ncbi:hypothetical protein [Microbacterium sp. GXF7504]
MSGTFDARALTDRVQRRDVATFIARLRAQGAVPASGAGVAIALVVAAVFGVAVLGVLGSVSAVFIGLLARNGTGAWFGVLTAVLPIIVVGALIGLAVWWWVHARRAAQERWYRLDRFAHANGMTFLPAIPDPPLPGMIFSIGDSRRTEDVVRGVQPRFVEFANHHYTTGSGKNRTTHRWGYVAIKLETPLPHIVLDAVGNNALFGASNLPASFRKDQRLSLEGDFDRSFALYCPEGYERDALYLFTPDIMARFIDNAAALDVEIVDDWLFLYTKRPVTTLDPATWAWLFSVVGALLTKLDQWARWRDDRLLEASAPGAPAASLPFDAPARALTPPPGVAREGRRLRRRVPWVPIVIGAVVVAAWFVLNSGVLGLLFR